MDAAKSHRGNQDVFFHGAICWPGVVLTTMPWCLKQLGADQRADMPGKQPEQKRRIGKHPMNSTTQYRDPHDGGIVWGGEGAGSAMGTKQRRGCGDGARRAADGRDWRT